MRIGPDRHLPVMRLMMIAQRHDADIAKALNLRGLVRLGTGDIHCPGVALLQRAKVPAGFLFKNFRVIGPDALIEITGLRNPCRQLDRLAPGLMQAVLGRTANGELIRKAGIMATVIAGGTVRGGDTIALVTKPARFIPLSPV